MLGIAVQRREDSEEEVTEIEDLGENTDSKARNETAGEAFEEFTSSTEYLLTEQFFNTEQK